jgi:hypothetical protein
MFWVGFLILILDELIKAAKTKNFASDETPPPQLKPQETPTTLEDLGVFQVPISSNEWEVITDQTIDQAKRLQTKKNGLQKMRAPIN